MRISDWSSDVCSSDLADRIAVHRGKRRSGLVAQGDDVLRKMAAKRFGKGDIFATERSVEREEPGLRFFDGEQGAHSVRQSPERPPLFSSRRMSPRTIARSSAFAMAQRVRSETEAAVCASLPTRSEARRGGQGCVS